MNPLFGVFFRAFHSDFSVNFCPSYDTKETLEKRGIQRVKIWSRGIDTSKFSPHYRKVRKNSRKLRILYVGRIAAEKDLDILLEAIPYINEKYKNEIEFVIVGDGPYMKQMVQSAPDNMIFKGYLKGQALSETYASCDIFAFPSSTETLGNVVLEAMASGLPVITVNSGGVTDNVTHNENGLLAKPRDPQSFAFMLEQIISNTDLRQRLTSNVLKFVKSKSWDHIFDQLMSDYKSIDSLNGSKNTSNSIRRTYNFL